MAEGAQVAVEIFGLEELRARIPDAARRRLVMARLLNSAALTVRAEAMKRAPTRTGNLRRSITTVVTPDGVRVEATAQYSPFVESGTGLYGPKGQLIHPIRAQAMRWPVGSMGAGGNQRLTGTHRAGAQGDFAYARTTKGMRPHPFMAPAWEASQPLIHLLMEREASALLEPGGGPTITPAAA